MAQKVAPPPLGSVSQIAYVVENMDVALSYWVDVVQAGPFFVFEHAKLENQVYREQPSNIDVTLAVANSGDTQIELIYCEDNRPSVYREFLDAGKTGVHHVGIMPKDYDSAIRRYKELGYDVAFACSIAGTDLVYLDTVAALGHFTELWERSDSFLAFQRSVREAAYNWDGTDPIRQGGL